jgi:uncharacterized protein
MMTFLRSMLAFLLALPFGMAHAQDLAPVPPLTSPVIDQSGLLSPSQRTALENVLLEYDRRTGSQIAVLLVDSTAPEPIEQYSIRVADQWKLGRKGVDDGVILIVAKDNPPALRRLRIEAGLGVQGSLTDAQSKRILQDIIAPHFRQNDFYGGLVAGISAIASLIGNEQLAPPDRQRAAQAERGDGIGWLPLLFIGFMIISMMRGGRRRRFSSNGWGLASGIILGSHIGRGHGGFGGGGFGGGGFSGGGGGFNGGGASGNW